MNKYIYGAGFFVLAFAMSGLPAIVSAEEGRGGRGEAKVRVVAQAAGLTASTTIRANDDDSATSSERTEDVTVRKASEQARENSRSFLFALENATTTALSLQQLKQLIEERRQQLDTEEASTTTPTERDLLKNANPVRLAVHSLLASKDLLGGIGPKVSEIAKGMNDSIATTTVAEAKIQSRGILFRIFLGGDRTAAEIIAAEVAKNQQRIDELNKLLAETNISAEVKATLTAQITALEAAQVRLQALADKEKGAWGLFSWRF